MEVIAALALAAKKPLTTKVAAIMTAKTDLLTLTLPTSPVLFFTV